MIAVDLYRTLCLVLSNQLEQASLATLDESTWKQLANLAENQGVAPLLYWRFKENNIRDHLCIPEEVYYRLKSAYYQTLSRNIVLYQELRRILYALEEAGIPAILLKGAALAVTLYEDIGLRPMGDIDLLIHKKDLTQIFNVMKTLGYQLESSRFRLWLMSGVLYEANFDGGVQNTCHVEFHWSLIGGEYSRYYPELDWFWKHSQMLSTKIISAKFLDQEPSLLYLSAHLTLKHGMAEAILLWMHDLYIQLKTPNLKIDWDEIINQAEKFHWESSMLVAIQEVCQRFDINLNHLAIRNYKNIGSSPDHPLIMSKMRPRTHLQSAKDEMKMVNWLGKCIWLVYFIFPPYSYLKQIYPSKHWNHQFIYTVFYWTRMTKNVFNTLNNTPIKPGKQ